MSQEFGACRLSPRVKSDGCTFTASLLNSGAKWLVRGQIHRVCVWECRHWLAYRVTESAALYLQIYASGMLRACIWLTCIASLYTCSNLSAWPEAVRGLPAAPKKQEFSQAE